MLLKFLGQLILFATVLFILKGHKNFPIETIITISVIGIVSSFVFIWLGAISHADKEIARIHNKIDREKENLRTGIEKEEAARLELENLIKDREKNNQK
jgi:cell division protein FtsW (lipid II flippase)